MTHPMKGYYNIEVINRFTRKIDEVYFSKTIGGVYSIEDTVLFQPWKKLVVYPLWDMYEQIEDDGWKELEE